MNERIKKLRKALGLTQQEFADKIGMKRNTIANYETDRNEPSNAVVSLICKTFSVSETWLRTGSGGMFVQRTEEEELDQVLSAIAVSDDELIKRIIRAYWRLDDREKDAVKKLIDGFSSKSESANQAQDKPPVAAADAVLADKVAALEKQNQALAARLEAIEKEDAEREAQEAAARNAGPSQFR